MTGLICSAPLYEYERNGRTWLFEYRPIGAPYWPVRSNGEPYQRVPRGGYEALDAFCKEPDILRFRVGGGCERF